ncbi:MAG: hypothetical protein CMJ46_04245 [Planctomyces sp.]|nr:hypothetical protein [Planctomyces sp.]
MNCPSSAELTELATGALPEERTTEILDHLSDCNRCLTFCEENFTATTRHFIQTKVDSATRLQLITTDAECKDVLTQLESNIPEFRQVLQATTQIGLRPGMILGNYQLIRLISTGGMGVIYEAEQLSLERRVALKFLLSLGQVTKEQLQRFKNEALAVGRLDHAHIIPVHTFETKEELRYLVMPYVDGTNLSQLINKLKTLGRGSTLESAPDSFQFSPAVAALLGTNAVLSRDYLRRSIERFIPIIEAIQYAHEHNIIHRDIKPSNLILDHTGKLWIGDFGVAKFESSDDITLTQHLIGTPRYMSPEQATGDAKRLDHRSDIYSLGVTLYEMLTLEPLFPATDSAAMLIRIATDEPVPPRTHNGNIPGDLETILLTAISKAPADRYHTAGDFALDLRRFLNGEPIHARAPTLLDKGIKWFKRNRIIASLSLLLFLAVSASSVVLAIYNHRLSTANSRLNDQKQVVEEANQKAQSALAEARQQNYALSMTMASNALEKRDSSRVQRLLEPFKPTGSETDLRGLEWFLLHRNETQKNVQRQQLTDELLYTLAIDPMERILAVSGIEGIIYLLDPKTLALEGKIPTDHIEINGLAFHPFRNLLASTGDDGSICIWDLTTREITQRIRVFPPPSENEPKQMVLQIAFTPRGKRIVVSCNDSAIRLFDFNPDEPGDQTAIREPVLKFVNDQIPETERRNMQIFKLLPDRGEIVGGGFDGSLTIWKLSSGERVRTVQVPAPANVDPHIMALDYDSLTKTVAIGTKDPGVYIWNLRDDSFFLVGRHDDPIDSANFIEGGQRLHVSDRSGTSKVWPLERSEDPQPDLSLLIHKGRSYYSSVSQQGVKVLTVGADGHVAGFTPENLDEDAAHIVFTSYAITDKCGIAEQENAFFLLDRGVLKYFISDEPGFKLAWNSHVYEDIAVGKIGESGYLITAEPSNRCRIWNRSTGEEVASWSLKEVHPQMVEKFLYSTATKSLICESSDRIISVIPCEEIEGQGIKPISGPQVQFPGVLPVLIRNDSCLAYKDERAFVIYNLVDKREEFRLEDEMHAIDRFTFTTDHETVFLAFSNRTIEKRDLHSSESPPTSWTAPARITSLAMTPDDKTLIVATDDQKLTLWSTSQGILMHSIEHPVTKQMWFTHGGQLITETTQESLVSTETRHLQILDFGPTWNSYVQSLHNHSLHK